MKFEAHFSFFDDGAGEWRGGEGRGKFGGNRICFQRTEATKFICLHSQKWSTLKEKNMLPRGANSFHLEKTLLRRGFDVHLKGDRKLQKLLPVFCKKKWQIKKNTHQVNPDT